MTLFEIIVVIVVAIAIPLIPFFLAGWNPSFRLIDRWIATPLENWILKHK